MEKSFKNVVVIMTLAGLITSNLAYASDADYVIGQELPEVSGQQVFLEETDSELPVSGEEEENTSNNEEGVDDYSNDESYEQTDLSLSGTDSELDEDLDTASEEAEEETLSLSQDSSILIDEEEKVEDGGFDTWIDQGEESGLDDDMEDIVADDETEAETEVEEVFLLAAASEDEDLFVDSKSDFVLSAASADDVYNTPAKEADIENDTFYCYRAQNPVHGIERIAVITGIKKQVEGEGDDAVEIIPNNGKVTVPVEIEDKISHEKYRVMYIANGAFANETKILELEFEPHDPDTLTGLSVGANAFKGCTGIKKLSLPENLFNLGNYAFEGCTGLNQLNVPKILDGALKVHTVLTHDNDGVSVKIGNSVFRGCVNLKNENNQDVTFAESITAVPKNLFSGCTSLESINLSGYGSMTTIQEYAFSGCSGLKNVIMPANLETIEKNAFSSCTSLESGSSHLVINDTLKCLDTIGDFAFSGCSSEAFSSLKFPESLRVIGNSAFNGCASLKNLYNLPMAPAGSGAGVSPSIGTRVFYNTAVTGINGSEITFEKQYAVSAIPKNLFNECTSLVGVAVPETVVQIQESAFYKCTSLKRIILPSSLTSIGSSVFSGCRLLQYLNLYPGNADNTDTLSPFENLTEVGASAFQDCVSLVRIVFPVNLTTIGSNAFKGCNSIDSIVISKSVSESTKLGTNIFSDCNYLHTISAASFAEGVNSIPDNLFYGANYLKSISLPEGIVLIGKNAFYNCNQWNDENIVLPDTVKTIADSAFCNCAKLKKIRLNAGLEKIGSSAFSNCQLLESISLPAGLNSLGNSAFSGCTSMNSVRIPVFTADNLSIGTNVFHDCDNLKLFTFDGKPTVIPKNLFYGCNSLEEIIIPDTVTEIGQSAFYGCESLYKMALPWSVEKEKVGTNAFGGTNRLKADDQSGFYGYKTSEIESYANENSIPFHELKDYGSGTDGNPYGNIPITGISLSETSIKLAAGNQHTLKVTFVPANTTSDHEIEWVSTNESAATVDASGTITAVAKGVSEIKAVSKANSSVTASCQLTVIPAPAELSKVTVWPSSLTGVIIGGKMDLTYSYQPENADPDLARVIWKSSNESVASVDENGQVTALAAGSVTITATAEKGSGAGSCSIRVVDGTKISTAQVDTEELVIDKGSRGIIDVSIEPSDATNKNFLWKSDDTSIASVSSSAAASCTVTGINSGETMVHAYSTDGSNLHLTRKVKVVIPVTGVSFSPSSITLNLGEKAALTANVTPDNAYDRSVEWSTLNSAVVTVDGDGVVTAVGKGSGKIKVVTKRNNKSATCTITVRVPVSSVSLNKDTLSLVQGTSSRLTAVVSPENANDKSVTWSSDNPSVATVSSGNVRGVAPGNAVITVTTKDGSLKANCSVTVTARTTTNTGGNNTSGNTGAEDGDMIVNSPESADDNSGSNDTSGNGGSSGNNLMNLINEDKKATIPKIPAKLKAKAKNGKVKLSWKKLKKKTKSQKKLWKKINGIEIRYSTEKSFAHYKTKKIGKSKKIYTLKGLQKGKIYYIKIRYRGKKGAYSKWSTVKKVLVK